MGLSSRDPVCWLEKHTRRASMPSQVLRTAQSSCKVTTDFGYEFCFEAPNGSVKWYKVPWPGLPPTTQGTERSEQVSDKKGPTQQTTIQKRRVGCGGDVELRATTATQHVLLGSFRIRPSFFSKSDHFSFRIRLC